MDSTHVPTFPISFSQAKATLLASSSLPSDVYSLGVSVIEIFTGMGPNADDRYSELTPMKVRRRLHMICSKMILGEREVYECRVSGCFYKRNRRSFDEVCRDEENGKRNIRGRGRKSSSQGRSFWLLIFLG